MLYFFFHLDEVQILEELTDVGESQVVTTDLHNQTEREVKYRILGDWRSFVS